jgi:hypothetical protein
MGRKKIHEYRDELTVKIEVILVGKGLDIEKYRRSMLAISNNLNSVIVSRIKIIPNDRGKVQEESGKT